MSKEAMKLTLEALENINNADNDRDFLGPEECCDLDNAITALREALAEQPAQQEPVECKYGKGGYACCEGGPCKADEQNNAPQPAQQEKDWGAVGEAHIAAIKKSSKAMVEDAVVRAVHKVMAEFEAKSDERLMKDWGPGPHEYHSLPAQQEPEFFTHCVDQPYDWSEWVCPDPKGYLMKCCDCGLVHEAEFGVVRYKSETEREDCDMVDDPHLQAVFRMRRSEQWSPADMAHRAGGLTMEQPAQQEPVAWVNQSNLNSAAIQRNRGGQGDTHTWSETPTWDHSVPLYTSPPAQRKPLDAGEISRLWKQHTSEDGPHHNPYDDDGLGFARAIEAKLKEKNT
ncbi:hypothetical protein [Phage DSL-LC05]|nr:hypothetical protein [Phage DSL-LC05]